MPTYIFKDKNSEEIFEFKMKMSELDIFKKKNPKLVQLPTAPSFRLKGSGWYETDFKTGKKKNISKEDSKKVWNVIEEMKKNGIEKTLHSLTNRWFTDEFIKNNPRLVKIRLKQVLDTDPEVFLKGAEILNLKSNSCVVFEDSIPGIEAAKAAGMVAIAITHRCPNLELATKLADKTIKNYQELPKDFFSRISGE